MAHETRCPTSPDIEEQVGKRCGMDKVVRVMPRTGVGSEDIGQGKMLSQEALRLLDRYAKQERPFYMQLGYLEVHRLKARRRDEPDYRGFIGDYIEPDDTLGVTVPGYLRDEPVAREELAELQGAVRYVDAAIGQVLEGLNALGLEENTLVVFTADHGAALPRAKVTLYDPGIEVPLIVRWPGRGWVGGRTQAELVSNVDVFPTLLDVIGAPVKDPVQGRSLLPLLEGRSYEPRDAVFAEMTYHQYYDPMRCIRTNRHKLIINFSASSSFMDPTQSWRPRTRPVVPKDSAQGSHPLLELYDLENDPWEQRNLADGLDCGHLGQELLGRLYEWMQVTGDPLVTGAVTSPMHCQALEALAHATSAYGKPNDGA
jgi:arylsulfatase A-like enzyme